jgi:LPS sulfotransferase NodH
MTHGTLDDYAAWVLHPAPPELPTSPSSSYLVCATPRSGSWLLCGLLDGTGVAGRPHEWFWRDTREANERTWGVSGDLPYHTRAKDAGTTPNGVFGAKVMWSYLDAVVASLGSSSEDTSDLARSSEAAFRVRGSSG